MARKPARTTTRTVGTSISNSNYSQSTKQNSNVFSGISNTETKGTLEYYESHPNTAISYDSDNYYGVYLYSKIYIKNNDSTFYYYTLQNLFNIDYEQANLILNSCKTSFTSSTYDDGSSHGDVDNTTIITLTKPVFLNNIDYKTFFSNITTKYNYESKKKDGVFKFYKDRNESEKSKNIYTLIYKKHNDGNGLVVAYFQIIFKKITPFNGKEVELNDVNQLFYNKYAVEFNSNIDIDDINIQYCDLFNYIWFRVKSKTEIKNIKLDNNFVHNNHYNPEHKDILTCYSYVANNMYNIEIKINDGDGLENIDYTYYGNHSNWKYIKTSYNSYIFNSTETIQVTQESENPEWGNTQSTQTVSVSTCNNINSINWYKSEFDNTNQTYVFEFKLNTIGSNNDGRITNYDVPPAVWLCGENFLYSLNSSQNRKNASKLNITLNFSDGTEQTGEATSTNRAIQVSANTHTNIYYVNPVKLYTNIGGVQRTLACIYELKDGEEEFNGNITVFYGNDLVYPYKKSGTNIVKGDGQPYDTSVFYYQTERHEDRIYIYLKTLSNSFKLKKFINIYLSDDDKHTEEETTVEEEYTNVKTTISQDEITVHTVDISIPQVSAGDESVYIDNSSNNKTKHYTNYSKLPTVNGYTYYGIRAYAYINGNEIEYLDPTIKNIGIEGLSYNVNANIVKLNPINEQKIIYSFKNGEQLLVLNSDLINYKKENNVETIESHEVLPTYLFSYEYIVENKKPENNDNTDYNLRFKLLYSNKNLVETTYQNIKDKIFNDSISGLYFAYISYTYSETLNTPIYNKLINVSADYPIEYNINETIDDNVYTYQFVEYSNVNDIDEDNLYEKVEQYVKISPSILSLDSFKQVVKNSQTIENDYNKYYKYSVVNNSYIPYRYNDVKDLNELPLNIYVKYGYYLKTGEHKENVNLSKYKRYKNNYNFTSYSINSSNVNNFREELNKLLNSSDKYYQKVDNTYIPYKGFVHDGSVEYYGFKFREISEEDTSNSTTILNKRFDDNSFYYLKQNYRLLETSEINLEKLPEFKVKNIQLYKNAETIGDVLEFIPVEQTANIYDLDLSGNTIYAFDDNRYGIISLDEIKDSIYKNIPKDKWYSEADENKIKRDTNSSYLLSNFDITISTKFSISNRDELTEHDQKVNIKYIVSLEGVYKEIDYVEAKSIYNSNIGNETTGLYVKETGFNTFKHTGYVTDENGNTATDSTGKLITKYNDGDRLCIANLQTYKTNNKLYTLLLSKLTANELSDNYKYLRRGNSKLLSKYLYKVKTGDINKYYEIMQINGLYNGVILNSYIADDNNREVSGNRDNIFDFYKINQKYEISHDIHMSINKQYFIQERYKKVSNVYIHDLKDNKNLDGNENLLVFNDSNILSKLNLTSNKDYSYNINDIKFYEYKTTYYTYCNNDHKTIESLNDDFEQSPLNTDYKNSPYSSYTGDVFVKTKYFYNSYCINDGINIDKNGTYYTNALVFDGKDGKISKKLYLNHHIQNLTKYSYDVIISSYVILDSSEVSNDISIYDYKNYYITYGGNNSTYYQLSQETLSPSYYVNTSGYELYTKLDETKTFEYNALDKYQLNRDEIPTVIQMNDQFYGIIFNTPIDETTYSYTIMFKEGDTLSDTEISYNGLSIDNRTLISEFDLGDNGTLDYREEIYQSALNTANNELYYNNFDQNNENLNLFLIKFGFVPKYYLYELVELSQFNFRNYNSDKSILQSKEIITNSINVNNPFTITNAEQVIFDGTYSWVPPTFKDIILDSGEHKTILEKDGYFHKNYSIEEKPLKVTSYNFYPKDEVSSINITYNFIPNSYILTAEINHPRISYVTMVNDIVERVRYSYILNGFEYDYPSTSPITYEDDTYYGTIKIKDIDGSYGTLKVSLYKKNDIVTTTNIKEIEHQKSYVSKEYFSYSQATPLTNEKIPVLYNTELIPASTHKVQFWDVNTNSYAIKTVIDSYAYYSYKYKYETVPFTVASYIFTEDLRISNFNDLGTYVKVIGESIGEGLLNQSYNVKELSYELNNIFSYQTKQEKIIADNRNDLLKTYINIINTSLSTFSDNTYNSVNALNSGLSKDINNLINGNNTNFENLSTTIKDNISKQYDILKEGLDNTKNTLEQKLAYLTESIHNDIIGDGVNQEKEVTTVTTTYTPKPPKATVPPIGPLAVVALAQTITQKNTPTEYTYETETKTETISTTASSLAEILGNSLMSSTKVTSRIDNEDGSYVIVEGEGSQGLGDILKDLKISRKIPDYNEFMCDLVPTLFSNVDFETEVTDSVKYDENGNITEKKTHKNNPTEVAKKCIMRADILWKEMKKKGIVS